MQLNFEEHISSKVNLMKYINIIDNVQNHATKLVEGISDIPYKERLKKLELPTLVCRRARGDMIELYKHFHIYHKDSLSTSFKPCERTSRKHGFQLHILKPNDGICGLQANSLYFRTAKIWNNLPKHVVDAKNINNFRKMLDEHWNHDPLKFDHSRIQSDS